MKTSHSYALLLLIFAVTSCVERQPIEGVLSLNPKYTLIQEVVSIANCSSPFGTYTTEVHSLADGSCYFIQKFSDMETPFRVHVDSIYQGYVMDETNVVLDTLSTEDVEMVRSHEIHKMSIDPNHFYSKLQFKKKVTHLEKDHELYLGEDRLGNPVRLLYSPDEKLISKIELRNPKDTTQTIELFYDMWVQSSYGEMAKQIHIVQAQKDTFFFDFNTLEVLGEHGTEVVI